MNTATLLFCLLMCALAGTAPRVGSRLSDSSAKPAAEATPNREAAVREMAQGGRLFQAGEYGQALHQFESAQQLAAAAGDAVNAARAICNIGACQYALHRYRSALDSFQQARGIAEKIGDQGLEAMADTNIASLYAEMGDLEAAVEGLQRIPSHLQGPDRKRLPLIEMQMARLLARQGRMSPAGVLIRQGIEHADRLGDVATVAFGWNLLGEELVRRGDTAAGEEALLEAYRLRKLNHLALDVSLWNLGRLRLEQGDLKAAAALLDLAVETGTRRQGVQPLPEMYADRSRVRLAQGLLRPALEDGRIAVQLARVWRSEPPDDGGRIGMEGILDGIHAAVVEAGNRLYLQTHDASLIRETFEAEEENRAGSLRALLGRRRAQSEERPPAYWEAVERLRRAESEALRTEGRETRRELASARLAMVRLEAALQPANFPPQGGLLDRVQAALAGDTAVFAFALGNSDSWMWAVDRTGLELYRLPGKAEIEVQVRAAADAIQDDSPQADRSGARLYRTLFGSLSPRFEGKRRWLLTLDGALFEAPLAALVVQAGGPRPVYVADRHVTETIPGAGFLLEAAARRKDGAQTSHLFLGIGDPIYNGADSRLVRPRQGLMARLANLRLPELGLPLMANPAASDALVLPRLVASRAELTGCARAWGGRDALLTGKEATARQVAGQLRRNPAVVHFATHVLESADGRHAGLIALSLAGRGDPELLTPEQIAGWNVGCEVVVLSGCHTARGAALPGAGLMGLTRAWLTAGARSVVASRWPMPDERGSFFLSFYRRMASQSSSRAGDALRAAQLEMIGNGGWRARPRYWAAYFVVGSD